MLGTNKVLNNRDGNDNDYETDDEEILLIKSGCLNTDRTANGLATDSEGNIVENRLNNLTKGEGYDSQVVTTETKSGKADNKSADTCNNSANHHGDNEGENSLALHKAAVIKNHGGYTTEVCANAHEARVTERELAKEAYYEG